MNLTFGLTFVGALAAAVPLVFLTGAALAGGRHPFRGAMAAAHLNLALALLLAAAIAGGIRSPLAVLRLDAVTALMLPLVAFIAWVIVRQSRTYLAGEAGQKRYARWLMATLSAVTTLILSNHLGLLALGWLVTSLCLHQLLTFYAERPQALVAAHKKFLASRVAVVCLFVGIGLLSSAGLPLQLDELARAMDVEALPTAAHAAAFLFVVAAVLKCAQLPFHGWLIQVMEAPTPVSALLHAGVVNIGGLLMIRLAPLMLRAQPAQTLLIVIGTVTAVLAALVMTTRVSVKVALAWSTCAQMGFMLLQCGLGAYQLALLHILAHSLYKAHAFLSSGSVVETFGAAKLAPIRKNVKIHTSFASAAVSLVVVVTTAKAFGIALFEEPPLVAFAFILALALAPMWSRARSPGGLASLATAATTPALYFGWHAAFTRVIDLPPTHAGAPFGVAIPLVAFASLFVVQAVMQAHPTGRLARALYPRLFAGLYLDEWFTRLTFRVWPPRLPPKRSDACKLFLVHSLKA